MKGEGRLGSITSLRCMNTAWCSIAGVERSACRGQNPAMPAPMKRSIARKSCWRLAVASASLLDGGENECAFESYPR